MADNPITGLNGQDVAADRALRDAALAEKATIQRDDRRAARGDHGGKDGQVRVTINAPHQVQCRGSNVAITIVDQGPAAGSSLDEATLLKDVVYLDTSDNGLFYTDIYTDGRKDAV